jgi:molecular chaperone IbpA
MTANISFRRLLHQGRPEQVPQYPSSGLKLPHRAHSRNAARWNRISLAVAGFKPDQINVTVEPNTLVVTGREVKKSEHDYLHRGIAARDFERRFSLADFVEVKDATFEDGLLQIDLVRELPEAMKPKRIEIHSGKSVQDNKTKTIEHMRAAS